MSETVNRTVTASAIQKRIAVQVVLKVQKRFQTLTMAATACAIVDGDSAVVSTEIWPYTETEL